jgi:hypothetical protein
MASMANVYELGQFTYKTHILYVKNDLAKTLSKLVKIEPNLPNLQLRKYQILPN